jgi:hypothetical protein
LSAILDGNVSVLSFGSFIPFIVVLVLGIIILSIIYSFINLAIPVMLYENVGVLKALSKVTSNAAHSISQVLVYWIIRGVLEIILGIAAIVISLIVILIAGIVLLLIGIVVYMILMLLGFGFTDPVTLIVIGLLFIASFITLIVLILLATVPLPVFRKYHALLFLRSWYADIMPFWEPVPESVPEPVP